MIGARASAPRRWPVRPASAAARRRRPAHGPRRAPPRRGRRALWAALLVSLVVLVVLFRREDAPAPPPAASPPPPAAVRAVRPPPVAPKRVEPKPAGAPSPRDRLLAAVRERSAELAECEVAPGSPTRATTRLVVSRAGVPRSVAFETARPLPAALATCTRERILRWRFDDLALPADVEVLVTFAFATAG